MALAQGPGSPHGAADGGEAVALAREVAHLRHVPDEIPGLVLGDDRDPTIEPLEVRWRWQRFV
jgi:hypothetical protein